MSVVSTVWILIDIFVWENIEIYAKINKTKSDPIQPREKKEKEGVLIQSDSKKWPWSYQTHSNTKRVGLPIEKKNYCLKICTKNAN